MGCDDDFNLWCLCGLSLWLVIVLMCCRSHWRLPGNVGAGYLNAVRGSLNFLAVYVDCLGLLIEFKQKAQVVSIENE